jgi:hypothetical protein
MRHAPRIGSSRSLQPRRLEACGAGMLLINAGQAPHSGGLDAYFFTSSSSVLASICMSIPAHTSSGDFELG